MKYDYDNFKTQITNMVREHYSGMDIVVDIQKIPKNNGLILDGIMIKNSHCNVCPTIYLNSYFQKYESGESLNKILSQIIQVYEENRISQDIDISFFMDWEKVRKRIRMKLVNKKMNRELLEECPNFTYLNHLSVVFYCKYSDDKGHLATILIHNMHMNIWNVSLEDILEAATENMENEIYVIQDILSVLFNLTEITDREILEDYNLGEQMYLMTSQDKIWGATVMLNTSSLKRMANVLGSSFYLIPSSIHECLAVKAPDDLSEGEDFENIQSLKDMVYEINRSQLTLEDRLSDEIFYFNRNTQILSIV